MIFFPYYVFALVLIFVVFHALTFEQTTIKPTSIFVIIVVVMFFFCGSQMWITLLLQT
jgi:hypothetical protein